MPQSIHDLGRMVKSKYPGQYDDLADDEVGRRVKAKFPGSYDDFADASPTLMESRREASRMEFEGNRPAYSPGSAALGFVESFGVDPASPILGTAKNLFTGAKDVAAQAIKSGNPLQFGIDMAPKVAAGLVEGPRQIYEGYQSNDPNLMAEGVGRTTGTAAQFATGGKMTGTGGPKTMARSVVDPRSLLTRAQKLRAKAEAPQRSAATTPITTREMIAAGARAVTNPLRRARAATYEKAADILMTPDERLRTLGAQKAAAVNEAERMSQARLYNERTPFVSDEPMNVQRPDVPVHVEQQLQTGRLPSPDLEAAWQRRGQFDPEPVIPEQSPIGAQRPAPGTFEPVPPKPAVDLALIEKGIAPAAGRAKTVQLFNADGSPTSLGRQLPDLVPEIVNVPPGPKFDAGLVKGLRRMEEGIEAADSLVPEGTVVEAAPIVEGLQSLADEAASYGNKRLANAIQQKVDTWAEMGSSIPWQKFRDAKRAFFKERNADINSATMRRAYGILMEASESVGGVVGDTLKTANARYSAVRKVIDGAGIDPVTGRRPAKSVGKVEQVKTIRQQP